MIIVEQAKQNDFEREEKARQQTFELLELEKKTNLSVQTARQLFFDHEQERLQNEHQFNSQHLEHTANPGTYA